MAELLIECPETGEPVSTGIYLDTQFLTDLDVSKGVLRECSACGGRHAFTDDDTFMGTDDVDDMGTDD